MKKFTAGRYIKCQSDVGKVMISKYGDDFDFIKIHWLTRNDPVATYDCFIPQTWSKNFEVISEEEAALHVLGQWGDKT